MATLLCHPALLSIPTFSSANSNNPESPKPEFYNSTGIGAPRFYISPTPRTNFSWASQFQRRGEGPICRDGERLCEAVDVVILTNGPGEVATWVKPVVAKLRRTAEDDAVDMRISVVLAPCPHASGGELQLLQSFEEIDRCQV